MTRDLMAELAAWLVAMTRDLMAELAASFAAAAERQKNERRAGRNPRLAFNADEADCCTCVDTCDLRVGGICRCLPEAER